MPFIGEIAALTAAFFWGCTTFLFELAGKRVGAFPINVWRVLFACFLLSLTLFFQQHLFYPVEASAHASFWLGLSGIVGLAIGDGALFFALVTIGPRLATLLLSLAPPLTTIIAWVIMGEHLGWKALMGILLTVTAIIWVVAERTEADMIHGSKTTGVIYGLIAALGQGLGVIFAKVGLTDGLDTLSATMLRMFPASIALLLLGFLIRQGRPIINVVKDKKMLGLISIGAIFGPFLGVWLSIVAVKYTAAGIASTLLATVPVLIIPLDIIINKRLPSWRAVAGTLLAVVGIALIFLR